MIVFCVEKLEKGEPFDPVGSKVSKTCIFEQLLFVVDCFEVKNVKRVVQPSSPSV